MTGSSEWEFGIWTPILTKDSHFSPLALYMPLTEEKHPISTASALVHSTVPLDVSYTLQFLTEKWTCLMSDPRGPSSLGCPSTGLALHALCLESAVFNPPNNLLKALIPLLHVSTLLREAAGVV